MKIPCVKDKSSSLYCPKLSAVETRYSYIQHPCATVQLSIRIHFVKRAFLEGHQIEFAGKIAADQSAHIKQSWGFRPID